MVAPRGAQAPYPPPLLTLRSRKELIVATVEETTTRFRSRDAAHPSYKWWALSCTSLGMLVATINSGTLIIALPDLERALHTSLLQLVWVILVYMIASTVLVLTAGRLSHPFRRKRGPPGGFAAFSPPPPRAGAFPPRAGAGPWGGRGGGGG